MGVGNQCWGSAAGQVKNMQQESSAGTELHIKCAQCYGTGLHVKCAVRYVYNVQQEPSAGI